MFEPECDIVRLTNSDDHAPSAHFIGNDGKHDSAMPHHPLYPPLDIPVSGAAPFTDYARWRLRVSDGGRHTWHYLRTDEECDAWPQSALDKYWLGLPTGLPAQPKPATPLEAARNGFEFYKHLQADDGHWPGEYGGVMFLIPGLVIGSYVTNMTFTHEEKLELVRLVINRAHPEDGGWGIHEEGHSTVFGTALNYVAMRLLGVSADHPVLVKARGTLHKLGGATGIPAWGKFWLSVLGVYDWEGNNPVPAYMWLLPERLFFHPHRWWIHTRNVYIPMSYLYTIRFVAKEDDTIRALREELYTQPYSSINWPKQRNHVCPADVYAPHHWILDSLMSILSVVEPWILRIPGLQDAALHKVYELVRMEDENTSYQTLGPVSKMMNLIVRAAVDGPESEAYKMHEKRRADFMWVGRQGMMMTGTNGSQLWDIAFVTQALAESGLAKEPKHRESLLKALEWLEQCQMTENPKYFEVAYRHAAKGAWPFSTKEQGYTVSDCTGEGLKSVLYLQDLDFAPKLVSERRLFDAVDILLGMQNSSGSYASYELIRGPLWLEKLNPAEVFGDIMTEFPYPECTTSSITGLALFRKRYPNYRAADIEKCIHAAVAYIHDSQKPTGVWVGSWGICHTYATQFALESLSLVGETYDTSERARRACDYLVSKQRADGGWGESYKSCELSVWVEHKDTQVVQTAWATLALIYARYPHVEPIKRAIKMVMDRQLPDGSWAQEAIEGVFNKNVAIAYPNFKFSFTIWMLGRAHIYLEELRSISMP